MSPDLGLVMAGTFGLVGMFNLMVARTEGRLGIGAGMLACSITLLLAYGLRWLIEGHVVIR